MAYAGIYDIQRPQSWLPRLSLSSVTKLHHTASRTSLIQTFINPSTALPIPSAKYTFPLYESSAVVSFRCYIGTRLVEGTIKEKDEASTTFQAAVAQHEPASLLEQQTNDVFTTSLGNVSAGETVRVEIEYIMELKHDAEVDGLRFTIPTGIAPRYGEAPYRLGADTVANAGGMKISVQVSMSSNITSMQSPSHPISVYLGGHSSETQANNANFNPQQALAQLYQTSNELGKDFILLVRCAQLSFPCALIETHPTIPNSTALMVTLVPKFNLPESTKPEVVFIVDRSGSMTPRVAPLKSSLSVFLKSLPVGVHFNICSFGSSHSSLWPQSRPYTDQSFREAQRHCDAINANFGGTEILPPIQSTIANRLPNTNLEIMVLTDGQVWNSDDLFAYVEAETARRKGDVRVFTLGIGEDVSHALVDGLARAGRGFSQVVSHEREGMEGKVARMLRGALSAHVGNYRLEWDGKPRDEDIVNVASVPFPIVNPPPVPSAASRRRINLFDPTFIEQPIAFSAPPQPQPFVAPAILEAPYKVQPLFPFSRSIAYVIFSSSSPNTPPLVPTKVWLRGTTPSGDELELEIPVQQHTGREETIHQLAARKALCELKDGTSYLHVWAKGHGITGTDLAQLVKREGARVGLKYDVASEWTSFVAVVREDQVPDGGEREGEGGVQEGEGEGSGDEAYEFVNADDGGGPTNYPAHRPSGPSPARTRPTAPVGYGRSFPVMMMTSPPPPPIPYKLKSSSKSRTYGKLRADIDKKVDPFSKTGWGGKLGSSLFGSNEGESDWDSVNDTSLGSGTDTFGQIGSTAKGIYYQSATSPSSMSSSTPAPPASMDSMGSTGFDMKSSSHQPPRTWGNSPPSYSAPFSRPMSSGVSTSAVSPLSSSFFGSMGSMRKESKASSKVGKPHDRIAIAYSPSSVLPAERLSSSEVGAQPLSLGTRALIDLQTYEGSFVLSTGLAGLLGVSLADLEAKLGRFVSNSDMSLVEEQKGRVWATVLAIKLFETRMAGERRVWGLVVDKARAWMREQALVRDEDVRELEKLAEEVLGV